MLSFNPLGKFVTDAALVDSAITEALRFHGVLPVLPNGSLDHLYDHWTVGHQNQNFTDYNGAIRFDGQHFHMDMPHTPADNAFNYNNNAPAAHTWLRNEGGFGISTDDMVFASENDFGPEPVTLMTLEYLCACNAVVAAKYSIDLSAKTTHSPYADENPLMTHAEAAMIGGKPLPPAWYDYGVTGTCERWDLGSFVALPAGMKVTKDMVITCGDALRTRSHLYKIEIAKRLAA